MEANERMDVGQEVGDSASWVGKNTYQSAGSLTESAAQARPVPSFEIEDVPSTGGTSWRLGMPWFHGKHRMDGELESSAKVESRYYGGLMKSQGPDIDVNPPMDNHGSNQSSGNAWNSRDPESAISKTSGRHQPKYHTKPHNLDKSNSLTRTLSNLTRSSAGGDLRLDDFHESEWTPKDSAYGAACPVCGCIPKSIRRTIEFTLILAMIIGIIYLVVTTSIHITNDRSNAANKNSTSASDYHGGQIALDDDLYIESYRNNDDNKYDDAYYYANVDDDDGGDDYVVVDDDDNYDNDDAYVDDDYVVDDDAYQRRMV